MQGAGLEILEEIGRGTSGVVFRARDRVGRLVAVKAMPAASASEAYALKREFRVRAGIRHPNLVQLHELAYGDAIEGAQCYFTMEHVEGEDLLRHVRDAAAGSRERAAMLLALLPRLLGALHMLHQRGLVHRDVKPSNILVTTELRPVLLDFGFAVTRSLDTNEQEEAQTSAGTPAYMAPEQDGGVAPDPSHDLYALGATLWHALFDEAPFRGRSWRELRESKLRGVASAEDASVLEQIASGWMSPDPARRPTAEQVLARLGVESRRRHEAFVGREAELALFDRSSARDAPSACRTTVVEGPSGIGKSTFVDHALRRGIEMASSVLVSRCYPAEQIPFSGIDGLIDGLASACGEACAARLRADERSALAEIFPMLRRSPVFESIGAIHSRDALALARPAFAKLVAALAAERPVWVWVDDLQWCDAESLPFLRALVNEPGQHRVVVTVRPMRSADVEHWLREVLSRGGTRIELEPFTRAEIEELFAWVDKELSDVALAHVARETGGLPSLIEHWMQSSEPDEASSMRERMRGLGDGLSADATRLLAILAIARAPIERVTLSTAEVLAEAELAGLGLLRSTATSRAHDEQVGTLGRARSERDAIELAHESLMDVAIGGLSAAQRTHCVDRLVAMIRSEASPRSLLAAKLLDDTGRMDAAAPWYARAGDEAAARHAWLSAAESYGRAMESPAQEVSQLRRKRARMLANAGQAHRAAELWEQAATLDGDPDDRIKAAEHLFATGDLEAGITVLRPAAREVGLRVATSVPEAAVQALYWRARTKLRGLRFESRTDDALAPDTRRRLDILWSVGSALGMADAVAAFAVQSRHVHEALEAGVPSRIARALATESVYLRALATEGPALRAIDATLDELERTTNDPALHGLLWLCRGYGAFLAGELGDASRGLDRARRLYGALPERKWEAEILERGALWVIRQEGDFTGFHDRLDPVSERARDSADWLTWMQMNLLSTHGWLAKGDVDRAEASLGRSREAPVAKAPWGTDFLDEHARLHVEVYSHRWSEAARRIRRLKLKWAPVKKFLHVRAELWWFEGLVAAHAKPRESDGLLTSLAQRLIAEASPWPKGLGWSLLGARRRVGQEERVRAYDQATSYLEAGGFRSHALVLQLRAAELREDAEAADDLARRIGNLGIGDVPRYALSLASPV